MFFLQIHHKPWVWFQSNMPGMPGSQLWCPKIQAARRNTFSTRALVLVILDAKGDVNWEVLTPNEPSKTYGKHMDKHHEWGKSTTNGLCSSVFHSYLRFPANKSTWCLSHPWNKGSVSIRLQRWRVIPSSHHPRETTMVNPAEPHFWSLESWEVSPTSRRPRLSRWRILSKFFHHLSNLVNPCPLPQKRSKMCRVQTSSTLHLKQVEDGPINSGLQLPYIWTNKTKWSLFLWGET